MENPYLKIRMEAARINAREWKERLALLEQKTILVKPTVIKPDVLDSSTPKTFLGKNRESAKKRSASDSTSVRVTNNTNTVRSKSFTGSKNRKSGAVHHSKMASLRLRLALSESENKLRGAFGRSEKNSLALALGGFTAGSSREAEIDTAINRLKIARLEFIEIDLTVESGFLGAFRKLGLWGDKEDSSLFVALRKQYLEALDFFRSAVIREFKKKKGLLFLASVKSIYRITVTDEIERLKREKERHWRERGLRGFWRERTQNYRETSAGLKLLLGVFLILTGFLISVLNQELLELTAFLTIILGMVISLEGVHQEMSAQEAIRRDLTRAQAFRRAERALGQGEKGLAEKLRKIHLRLEEDIWQVRKFEKRLQYSGFLFPLLLGAVLGGFLALSLGLMPALKVFLSVCLWRLLLIFFVPFDSFGYFFGIGSGENQKTTEEYPEEKAYI